MVGSRYGRFSHGLALFRSRAFVLLGFLGLTTIFWSATSPVARGRVPTPADLIQESLSRRKTIKTANKGELTGAICRAIKRYRDNAGSITSAAVNARPELAAEITATVVRCAGRVDCDFVAKIVAAAIHANSGSTNAIADAAVARAPDCLESIQRAAIPVVKKQPSPTPAKTESPAPVVVQPTPEVFDPLERLRLVCDSGSQRAIRAGEVEEFLRTHPGAVAGACPPTPSPSPSPTLAPATLLPPPTALKVYELRPFRHDPNLEPAIAAGDRVELAQRFF